MILGYMVAVGEVAPNPAWCVLKSHRLLAGESLVLVRVRPPSGDSSPFSGIFMAVSFFPLDGFAAPAAAPVTQTVRGSFPAEKTLD